MVGTAGLIGVAAASFVSTDVDTLVLTTAQVSAAPASKVRSILVGESVGIAVLVVVSLVVGRALYEISTRWVGLLGLVPIALGIRALVELRRGDGAGASSRWPTAGGAVSAALVTIGSGGDNLAVYIPLFRGVSLADSAVVVGVFAVLNLGLCLAARAIGRHPRTLRALERAGVYATPVIYLAIGVFVLVRAGTLSVLR